MYDMHICLHIFIYTRESSTYIIIHYTYLCLYICLFQAYNREKEVFNVRNIEALRRAEDGSTIVKVFICKYLYMYLYIHMFIYIFIYRKMHIYISIFLISFNFMYRAVSVQ
jgi:hypothetical protein